MAKPEWGTKRACLSCGARFYDFARTPIVCPSCETEFVPDAPVRSRRSRPEPKVAKPKPAVETEDEELEEDDDALLLDDDDDDDDEDAVDTKSASDDSDDDDDDSDDIDDDDALLVDDDDDDDIVVDDDDNRIVARVAWCVCCEKKSSKTNIRKDRTIVNRREKERSCSIRVCAPRRPVSE